MESTRIVQSQRRAQLTAQELTLYKQAFVLVPYQPSGYMDITNKGFSNGIQNADDHETFKRMWTGNDAFVIQWKNSISASQNMETKQMEINFKLGEVILGNIETNSFDNQINMDESYSAYKSQQNKDVITFRISPYFDINSNYQFLFWKIPEISGSTVYRMVTLERDYVGNKLIGYVATFESLNQELANTGKARQQNIMPNSPGQGYLECIVEDSTWPERLGKEEWDKLVEGQDYYSFYDRYITADFKKRLNNPVHQIIVKCFGNAFLNCISLYGRPTITGDDFRNFESPRLIFPMNFKAPDTPNLFNTQANENNFFFCNFSPTILYWKEWQDNIKNVFLNTANQWAFNGFLEYDFEKAKSTNPENSSGAYSWELYGKIENTPTELKLTPWEFSFDPKDADTSSVEGCSSVYHIGQNKKIHDHFMDNYFTTKSMKTLPITVKNSFNFGNTVSSLLMLNAFSSGSGEAATAAAPRAFSFTLLFAAIQLALIGISYIYNAVINRVAYQNFRGIISAPFLELNNDQWKSTVSQGNRIEAGVLTGDENSPTSMYFDSKTMNIGIKADLTHKFYDSRLPNVPLDTVNIGQSTFENGDYILGNKAPYLLNGSQTLVDTNYGFIIDKINICAIFKGEYSIEFLDYNENIIWTGVFQSEGKWTNSIREIWTEKITSVFGRENLFFREPIPYPLPLPPIVNNLPLIEQTIDLNSFYYNNETGTDIYYYADLYQRLHLIEQRFLSPTSSYYTTPTSTYPEIAKDILVIRYNTLIPDFQIFKNYYYTLAVNNSYVSQVQGLRWAGTTPSSIVPDEYMEGNNNLNLNVSEYELGLDYDTQIIINPNVTKNLRQVSSGTSALPYAFIANGPTQLKTLRLNFYENEDKTELHVKITVTSSGPNVNANGTGLGASSEYNGMFFYEPMGTSSVKYLYLAYNGSTLNFQNKMSFQFIPKLPT